MEKVRVGIGGEWEWYSEGEDRWRVGVDIVRVGMGGMEWGRGEFNVCV